MFTLNAEDCNEKKKHYKQTKRENKTKTALHRILTHCCHLEQTMTFFDEGSNSSNKQNNDNMHDSPVVPGDVSFESIMPLPVDVLSRLMSLQDEGSLSKRESPSDRPNVLNGDMSP